jgi:hypothetical protein
LRFQTRVMSLFHMVRLRARDLSANRYFFLDGYHAMAWG